MATLIDLVSQLFALAWMLTAATVLGAATFFCFLLLALNVLQLKVRTLWAKMSITKNRLQGDNNND